MKTVYLVTRIEVMVEDHVDASKLCVDVRRTGQIFVRSDDGSVETPAGSIETVDVLSPGDRAITLKFGHDTDNDTPGWALSSLTNANATIECMGRTFRLDDIGAREDMKVYLTGRRFYESDTLRPEESSPAPVDIACLDDGEDVRITVC